MMLNRDDTALLRYNNFLSNLQVHGLTHSPLSVIAKAGVVMDIELLMETLPISWQLLLYDDQQLVSVAGKS